MSSRWAPPLPPLFSRSQNEFCRVQSLDTFYFPFMVNELNLELYRAPWGPKNTLHYLQSYNHSHSYIVATAALADRLTFKYLVNADKLVIYCCSSSLLNFYNLHLFNFVKGRKSEI